MFIQKLKFSVAALLLSSMISATAMGEDIEIYLGVNTPKGTYATNVLFIIDTSGSMDSSDGGSETRLMRVQSALVKVLESATNINAGLMRFTNPGGPVLYPVRPIDEAIGGTTITGASSTVREKLINIVNGLTADGRTPIVDTLYEASSYYAGSSVDYGLTRRGIYYNRVSHRLSYDGADSVLSLRCSAEDLSDYACKDEYIPAGAVYISPISDKQCQTNNHIVLLSDGSANGNDSVGKIQTLLGGGCSSGNNDQRCGPELVANISQEPNDSAIGAQVITHTIGFETNGNASAYLAELASAGGGGFYQVDNTDTLITAFNTIINVVEDSDATFVSPGVAVNQLNRLSHKDELYFALFKPSSRTDWPGNLKKYKIRGSQILGRDGAVAVDSSNALFTDNAHSYWSVLADGNDVQLGGVIGQLDLVRKLYTFDGAGAIATRGNTLHENNNTITVADLAIPNSSDLRRTLLKWARGVDIKDHDGDGRSNDVRLQMGDPIHSGPVVVDYSETDSAIFIGTNQGFLHSFDSETGEENFAIIPKELLSNLHDFYKNEPTTSHTYGLDGDIVFRNVDNKKYLYVGMRRGGRNYYVFDVTNKNAPRLVFKIQGGSGGFAKLGQTWSRPVFTKIKVGGSIKNVMIVGGGYDPAQDSKTTRSPDTMGNAVYIIDADNGSLLWSVSNTTGNLKLAEMKYSIPARVAVVDRDSDGFADHMYVGDMGGQLFRLDIHQGKSASDLVSGGLIASLGGGSATENRRFYYAPDVSEISLAEEHYYAVAIGSGFRAHPLNVQISDNFYMLKDFGVFNPDDDGHYRLPDTPVVESNFYDASAQLLTSGNAGQKQLHANLLADSAGWMIELSSGGEKVLASPLIIDNKIFFSTYLPASSNGSLCGLPTGTARAYLVELFNANGVNSVNRFAELKQAGIPPEGKIVFTGSPGTAPKPVICVGIECAATAPEVNANGSDAACTSEFNCLAENIHGHLERVRKSSWKTETERQ